MAALYARKRSRTRRPCRVRPSARARNDHSSALRETSVLWGSLIGTIVLGESFGYRRVLAAMTVVAGLLLMHFAAFF